jgi:hypothetical protein
MFSNVPGTSLGRIFFVAAVWFFKNKNIENTLKNVSADHAMTNSIGSLMSTLTGCDISHRFFKCVTA